MGITGGLVFIAALIAFVLGPRRASTAVQVSTILEERPDSGGVVAERNRAAAQIAAADSALQAARRLASQPQPVVIDTFPPEAVARRQAISQQVATLNRLIERANSVPLPSSYRALGNAAPLANDPQVQPLLDQLSDIEREREAFGTVSGVDPVYVALTSRATAIGRSIQVVAEARRGALRQELATLRPPPPPEPPRALVDTARYHARREEAQLAYANAVATLSQIKATNDRIDQEMARARQLANLGAPPLAMLAAALVLAVCAGFAASLLRELRVPAIADEREAEFVSGARVLTVIRPNETVPERSRRRSDAIAPPIIDTALESYRRLYLHLAATGANLPAVTVAGDDAPIVAAVAANIAASAAYEGRSTLLVDIDAASSTLAAVFHIPPSPGLAEIMSGETGWPEAAVQQVVGRDKVLDVVPAGSRQSAPADPDAAARMRGDFARLERRYDLIVLAAPTGYVLRSDTSIIPGPDIVLCARVAHTRINRLRRSVEKLRGLDLRIHGLVLWDDDMPVVEAQDDLPRTPRKLTTARTLLAGTR